MLVSASSLAPLLDNPATRSVYHIWASPIIIIGKQNIWLASWLNWINLCVRVCVYVCVRVSYTRVSLSRPLEFRSWLRYDSYIWMWQVYIG